MAILQLLNINYLNNDYNHTIDFPDLATQTAYYDEYVNTTINLPTDDDYVYIRENKMIRVDSPKSNLDGVNYLRFSNGSKWWYAFIISKDYVNENTTDLYIEIDVLQTFMFDYTLKESFISRQHEDRYTSNGDPKFNLKDENLDLGSNYTKTNDELINDTNSNSLRITCALVVSTKAIETGGTIVTGSYGPTQAMSDPLFYYIIPIANRPTNNNVYDSTQHLMSLSRLVYDMARTDVSISAFTDQQTLYSNIVSINILPYLPFDYGYIVEDSTITLSTSGVSKVSVVTAGADTPMTTENRYIYRLNGQSSSTIRDTLASIDFSAKLGIPNPVTTLATNKSISQETKLYTFPFTYFTLDDNQTQPLIIKPQFTNNLFGYIKFNQALSTSPIIKYYITNYLGDTGSDYTLINNTTNNINLTSSKLADYLNDNRASATTGLALNNALDISTNALRTTIGIFTGNPFAIANAISDAKATAKRIIDETMKRQDLQLGSPNYKEKGNNIYAYLQQFTTDAGLHFKKYSIVDAFKQVAYELFYHYGYACRDFGIPDIKSRYYFNYIQSPDICLDTGIDNEYISKIKNIFANGITFWHYRDANTWQGIENYHYENVEMNLLN